MSLYDLKKEEYQSLEAPIFVLSTGRCRTKWLTTLLAEQKDLFVLHDPEISFLEEGKLIYESELTKDEENLFLRQLVCTGRDHLWLDCAKRNLRYIETNNRITFAAPILSELLKDSKFVHLTRHPLDFIKSGRNRNWYEGNSHDLGRIEMSDKELWSSLTLNQKIGWLWLETNQFILTHTKNLSPERIFTIQSEKLEEEQTRKLYIFLKLDEHKLDSKWFGKKINIQENNASLDSEEILKELERAPFIKELKVMCTTLGYSL